jgi:MerR family transcriptional regulator, heat shock protein HspR
MVKTRDMYLISVAAEMLDMHPQTLRKYERLGLVRPLRSLGSMRVYTSDELDRLRLIKTLVDGAGVNLEGVRRLLTVADIARRLRPLLDEQGRAPSAADLHGRLVAEVDALFELLGLDDADDDRKAEDRS